MTFPWSPPEDDYPYSPELEQQLINCIRTHSYEKCVQLIDTLIEDCMTRSFPSIQMVRYFSYDLLGTFLKIAVNQHNDSLRDFLLSAATTGFLLENETSRSLLLNLKEVAMQCVDFMRNMQEEHFASTIYGEIKAFVDEHYDNPNINVNRIAIQFHINASQLSSRFKQIYGVGLLDYISQRRIETARHLLITTDLPVNQIAQKIGYSSQRTFLRVFSNMEKMSPGKYRQFYSGTRPDECQKPFR